jgi:glycosyltransferase involved in cell wall biosynthesis
MEEVVSRTSFVHTNGIDKTINNYFQFKLPKLPRDYISIFYGSGTKTHDDDFEVVSSSLVDILAKHENVRLTIVGYLALSESLLVYANRIDQIKYLSIEPYFELLSQADINIAPLRAGIFEDCKSEIKWLEAAFLKVPSIVSATQTYLEIIEDGVDGLIATTPQEWFNQLDELVSNPQQCSDLAERAYQKAQAKYSVVSLANNLQHILHAAIEEHVSQGTVVISDKSQKKNLLFVNVLYPPQSLGGATVVMKNIIDTVLKTRCSEYNIHVFTCDVQNSVPYQLSEYTYDNVHVTSLSVPNGVDEDWRYQDTLVHEIFKQYIDFNSPDLIHFHCIQRLTASMLVASAEAGIPYIVTVHDAWWLGDHQFLIDKQGVECDPRLNDPIIAARHTTDINNSIIRRRYLAQCLNQAKYLFAVSEFQAEQYRNNGFTQVKVNRNGILPRIVKRTKSPSPNSKVRLGFAGGICLHKGFYLLKEAIGLAKLKNTELKVIVVDLSKNAKSVRHENWGSTLVTFVPALPPEKMPDFFASIDVLIAPSVWTESFGLITREAAMAGLWVVASNKGGLAEDIRPTIDGDVFSPEKIDELVTILQRIDREPERYHNPLPQPNHIRTVKDQVSELLICYDSIFEAINIIG